MSLTSLSLRNSSLVDPRTRGRSVRALAASMQMSPPLSLRAMLERRDRVRVQRWGVCVLRFPPQPATTTMDTAWYERAFNDMDGVAAFFRLMSGGRRYVEWRAYGPMTLLTWAQKVALHSASREAEAYRAGAAAAGVPVAEFDRFLWVMDDGVSEGGTNADNGDRLVGAKDFSPQLACHEMVHSYGVCSHADRAETDDYADPFCIMGKGPVARSFDNPRVHRSGAHTHATTGPGICAPYLYVTGWLEYGRHVIQLDLSSLGGAVGTSVTLDRLRGAPPEDYQETCALALGSIPTDGGSPAQLWVEYRHTSGFDRRVDTPVWSATADLPREGAVVVHRVTYGSSRCPDALHSMVSGWCGATPGATVDLPGTGRSLRVLAQDNARRQVSVSLA